MDPKRAFPSPSYLFLRFIELRAPLFSGGKLRSPSPETQTPLQSSLEPWAPDNRLSSFQYGHTSSMPIYIQQALTSSPATVSHPTPSTTLSLLSSTPDHMQHYTIPASAMDAHDPVLGPSSPLLTQDDTPKKIPRPPNAFMLFRSWLIHDGKLPPEIGRRQQDISRIAGKAWNLLDESSKDGWRKEAIRRLHDHERKHPGYKFEPSAKSRRTGLEKIRKAADDYAKDHRAVNPTPARRPRQRASSYKFPAKEHTPQQLVRGPQIPQLITGLQLGSPSMASLITFDSPSPSSVGPLPLHTRSHAFLQGMPRQPSPYSFLPPGHPGHFERAHRHENGVHPLTIPRPACSKLTQFF